MTESRAPAIVRMPIVVALLAVTALLYWRLFPLLTSDVVNDYVPWFNHAAATGPIASFARPFGSYAPPYLYLLAAATPLDGLVPDPYIIKLVSVFGTLLLAGALARLLAALGVQGAVRLGLLVIAVPSAAINAALLGQCDALYVAPCLMALAAAIERRHVALLAWCGVAIGVKLQAAFFGPFVLALLIQRRVPLHLWPVTLLAWLATMLPAWAAGWPGRDLLSIYFRQTDTFTGLSLNAPNIWMIAQGWPGAGVQALGGIALAAAIAAAAACVIGLLRRPPLEGRRLLEAALLAQLLVVGLLPRMHERYFFFADIVAIAIAFAWPDRRSLRVACLVQAGSVLALLAYLSGIAGLAMLGAAAMIVATGTLARTLFATPAAPPAVPAAT